MLQRSLSQTDILGESIAAESEEESGAGARTAAEGWAHVMDNQCCVAMSMSRFGKISLDSIDVGGDGSAYMERRWDVIPTYEASKNLGDNVHDEALLRSHFHFVPYPPQRSAATQPQAMLAPLQLQLREGR